MITRLTLGIYREDIRGSGPSRSCRLAREDVAMPCRVNSTHVDLLEKTMRDIAAGRLPCFSGSRTWDGRGTGRVCAVCEQTIEPEESELETETPDGSLHVVFHVGCYSLWLDACRIWIREMPRFAAHRSRAN